MTHKLCLSAGLAIAASLLLSCGASGGGPSQGSDDLGGGSEVGGESTETSATIPCDVQQVLQAECHECHGSPTLYGAPMSLLRIEDFHAPAASDPSVPLFHKVHERINSPNETMPPNARLAQQQLNVLNAWLQAGAPAGSATGCSTPGQSDMTPTDPSMTPTDPTDPVPPPTTEPTDPTTLPPGTQCHIFRAHGQPVAGDTSPYGVGTVTDLYINFSLNAPWQGTVWATSFRPITTNPSVVHHYLLYKEGGAVPEGNIYTGIGEHPGAELTYGWAPGALPLDLPGGVGFEMPSTGYTLELHYNSTDPSAVDSSGVEVCYSTTPPQQIANMTWLGTDNINGTEATGLCNPWNGNAEPIHILSVWPHMHVAGVHMTSIINRADGTQEPLHDQSFDFNYQVNYEKDVWLYPGDTVTTTCFYNRPSVFGQSTQAEMCYLFTVATPGGHLSDGGSLIAHGPNTCGVRYCLVPDACFL